MPRTSAERLAPSPTWKPFAGFVLPTSNTTYTPNQFFDVCLPNSSRGCVRLVALLIRRTLGWCDAQGRPQAEQFALSYSDLERAGIARGSIKPAIAEAVKGHFIRCVLPAQSKRRGQLAVTAKFELQWDEGSEYIKDPRRFRGFFAGEGNRSYIPNQFFDHLVASESLAVVRAVGSVARFSIGFANKWGHRRTTASLSFTDIQRYTHISDRKTVSAALATALAKNYLQRVEEGYFDRNGGRESRSATYALRWLSTASENDIGSKTPPAQIELNHRFKKSTGNGSKTPPADRFKNPTGIQIKETNKTFKQQAAAPFFKEKQTAAAELLEGEGFDADTSARLAAQYPIERIMRQVEWLDRRRVSTNRLGLLRVAIEKDWDKPRPSGRQLGQPNFSGERDPSVTSLAEHLRRRAPPSTDKAGSAGG